MTNRGRRLIEGVLFGAIVIAALVLFAKAVAQAQPASPSAKGEAIAKRLCANCHSITTSGKSPHGLAPPFRELPKRYPVANLAEALAEGIVVAHKDMPQFTFDPPEIEALLAFMDSLAPDARRR